MATVAKPAPAIAAIAGRSVIVVAPLRPCPKRVFRVVPLATISFPSHHSGCDNLIRVKTGNVQLTNQTMNTPLRPRRSRHVARTLQSIVA
jgi:hypothetical protein